MPKLPFDKVNIPLQLDAMLDWFCSPQGWHKSHTIEDTFKGVVARNSSYIQLNADNAGVMWACLNKLIKDNYVDEVDVSVHDLDTGSTTNQKMYKATYDGLLFKQTGGYKAQRDREHSQKLLRLWERIAIAVGSVLAGGYGLFQMIDYIARSMHVAIALNSLAVGICIGLSIWLLVQLLKLRRK